jgi:membrane-bound metal-dependent hydrolase YbcI (DUF457 family)
LDNITHTLFGATLSRAVFAKAGRGTTAVLIIASNIPDADIVAAAGGSLSYLAWHRGPTHGPLGVIGLGLATAGLVWSWLRYMDGSRRAEHATFRSLLLAAVVGLVGHVLMDFPTSYGTRLLSPFDWHWYAADLIPIVDIYLLVVLAAGLAVGGRFAALRQRTAAAALAFMALNYGVRAVSHQMALATVPIVMAPIIPSACPDAVPASIIDRWPRGTPAAFRNQGATRCLVEVAVVPSFLSPFRWQVIVRLSDAYQTLDVNLLSGTAPAPTHADADWRRAARLPDQWTPAVLRAADTDIGRVFLDFSRFPAASSELHADRSATVAWTDLRFANVPGRPAGRSGLFVATVVLDPNGRVTAARLGEREVE